MMNKYYKQYLDRVKSATSVIVDSYKHVFPIEFSNYKVDASNIRIETPDLESLSTFQNTKLAKGTLLGDVYADVIIYQDGRTASTGNKVRLGRVPLQTQRGTFMVEGKEYSLPTQLRLGYGAFVHATGAGDITAQFNIDSGRGFNMHYDPLTKVFQIKAGGRIIGLLPILIGMGVSHSDLQREWGDEIYNANKKKYGAASVKKEIEKANLIFGGKSSPRPDDLQETLGSFTMDPEINEISIGKKVSNVSPRLLLTTSKKILRVIQKKEQPVDRDQLQYKYVINVDEYFKERISAAAVTIKKKIISKLKKYGADVDKVFEYDYGTGPVMAMLKNYTQVSYDDQSNPYAFAGERKKVTVVGTGGIENERQLTPNALKVDPTSYGYLDSTFTPDGSKIGAVTRMAQGVMVKDKKMHRIMRNLKTNNDEYVDHRKSASVVWATGDQYYLENGKITDKLIPKTKTIDAYKNGKLVKVPASEVVYVAQKPGLFNEISQSVPFLSSTQGNRISYYTKMMLQELPLVDSEKRYVKSIVSLYDDKNGKPINPTNLNEVFGSMTPDNYVTAPVSGVISRIDNNAIHIKDSGGKIHKVEKYDFMPLNGEAFMKHDPTVKTGDTVKSGDIIATAPYIKDGEIATGKHLNTAYLPLEGYTLDDGVAMSESGAKKMTSMHLYQFDIEYDIELDKNGSSLYSQQYPGRLSQESRSKLDEKGIVKKGVTVNHGDYLAIKIRKRSVDETSNLKKLHRSLIKPWIDMSLIWEENVPGKVVRVIPSGDGYSIHVSTEEPMVVGDKIKNMYANKATISAIIPDDEMPKDKYGNHVELAISPLAVPSRINPSQLMEIAANKISIKTGKPYYANQFEEKHVAKELMDKMNELGIPLEDDLTYKNKTFKAYVGPQYINKLEHQSRKKMSSRYMGGYDANLQPSKGQATGGHDSAGESMDTLTTYSLLSHNAHEILKDVNAKSERNVPMWNAIELGLPLPPKKRPYAFDKMLKYIEGAGVKVKERNGILQLLPTTDKEILRKSSGRITDPNQVHAKNLKPIKGGLYDPDILGGLDGESMRSGHIELPTKIPNPIVVANLAPVFGMKTSQVEGVAREKMWVNPITLDVVKKQRDGYYTGWQAFKKIITKIDTKKKLAQVEKDLKSETNTTKLSALLRQATILRTITQNNMSIEDLFLSKMPVLSAAMRPLYIGDDGSMVSSEINKFYKNTLMASNKYKELLDVGIPPEDKTMKNLRSKIYDEYKAYQGLTVPGENDPVGLLRMIKGRGESKHGFFWNKITSKKQDLSGHSVIGPDINIGVDNISLPEDMGWNLYAPFIIKRLIGQGYKPLEAKKHLQDKTETARRAMLDEVEERPLLMNRNPSLHKFNIMATKPIITKSRQIGTNPLVHNLFSLDYDGNCCVFDTALNIRFIKKRFNEKEEAWYNSLSNKDKEASMRAIKDTILKITNGDVDQTVEIGNFPRLGFIKKDKNGADTYAVPDGVQVQSYDPIDNQMKYMGVYGVTVESDSPIVKVIYKRGKNVTVSSNESLAIFDHEDGEIKKTKPEDAIGKMSPIAKKDFSEYGKEWDFDYGWMLGSYISDGWISRGRQVGYAKLEKTKRDLFVDLVREHITPNFIVHDYESKPGEKKYGKSMKVHLNGKEIYQKFAEMGISESNPKQGRQSLTKKIPNNFISNGSEDFMWGLFSGLIDGDGTVAINTFLRKPRFTAKFATSSPALRDSLQKLCYRLGIRTNVTTSPPRGRSKEAYVILFSTLDIYANLNKIKCKGEREIETLNWLKNNPPSSDPTDIIPVTFSERKTLRAVMLAKKEKALYSGLSKGVRLTRKSLKRMLGYVDNKNVLTQLKLRVSNTNVIWDYVVEVEDKGVDTVYDLMVDKTKVFAVNNGLIIYDTVSLYTPVSAKAVAEAKEMLPSKVLFHPGSKKVMLEVYQDALVGLYKGTDEQKDSGKSYVSLEEAIVAYNQNSIELTDKVSIAGKKAGLGRHWVNSVIPSPYKNFNVRFDKRVVKDITAKVAKDAPDKLSEMIEKLQRIGVKFATNTGVTLGIKDLVVDIKPRDNFFMDVEKKIKTSGLKSVPKLLNTATDLIKKIDSNNNFMIMMDSGGKGNTNNIGQSIFSPLFVTDHKGEVIPTPIKKSYAEGLTQTEFLNTLPGVRRGGISKKKEIAEPGFLNKLLVTATSEESISMKDCGTTRGIFLKVDDPDIEGRYLSKPIGGFSRNTLVTPIVIGGLRATGVKSIEVRSPMTCNAPRGICQMCYGIDEHDGLPAMGRNVGVIAANTLAEPLSQGTLSQFHTGGSAMGGSVVGLLDSVSHMLKVPQSSLKDATLSILDGSISKIKKIDTGGFDVTVKNKDKEHTHFIHPLKDVSVKLGDKVEKGGNLTYGLPNFRDYYSINGKQKAQNHMSNSLKQAYKDNGHNIDSKIFETVVRSMSNGGLVKDSGSNKFFLKGDNVPLNYIHYVNGAIRDKSPVPVSMTSGWELGKTYGDNKKGELITADTMGDLRRSGQTHVVLQGTPMKVEPQLNTVFQIPHRNPDLLERMTGQNIVSTLSKSIVSGLKAETDNPFQTMQKYISGTIGSK